MSSLKILLFHSNWRCAPSASFSFPVFSCKPRDFLLMLNQLIIVIRKSFVWFWGHGHGPVCLDIQSQLRLQSHHTHHHFLISFSSSSSSSSSSASSHSSSPSSRRTFHPSLFFLGGNKVVTFDLEASSTEFMVPIMVWFPALFALEEEFLILAVFRFDLSTAVVTSAVLRI